MSRRSTTATIAAAAVAFALAMVPLTAGGQEGRSDGAVPGAAATEPAGTEVPSAGDWDGDGPQPRNDSVSSVEIESSLCVGVDCVINGEAYGFDTIRLKENNLRIMFVDTSSTASFPRNDWQLVANQSANGGQNYFALRDCGTADTGGSSECGTRALTVEAGADNDSIYVDSIGSQGGNVGFGTASPVVDLHALSGNTPTLRLDQDGSSGFAPQVWDVAGNEANFFVRDVTNGSALPFRIQPGTGTNTLYLANDEEVGIGTNSPEDDLHIVDAGAARVRMENTSTGDEWIIGVNASGNVIISLVGSPGTEMLLDGSGNMTVRGNLTIQGTCTDADGGDGGADDC